ncbi:hypothetical protein [Sphingobacterium lactis]|uniref:Uncharacterized protein n=1 Tax=Sphingobacterium lactis TaxID=797291 RepID=A0A1H6CRW4_9SPHI|nr:hypothetical protein [Sphingobacterium lactis]SEG75383.1 hypothetical protein SAMN05421877_1197 [Sphingobacterium lactis]
MKFKGTKGSWYRNTESRIVSSVYSENKESLIHISGRNNEEAKANAQLIAHAPEMLEMLDKIYNDRLWGNDYDFDQLKDLLTRATTI